jgi:hypothetical protein
VDPRRHRSAPTTTSRTLGKVGFDSMNGNDFADVPGMEVPSSPAREPLIGSLDTLRQFHIVFFPCNTGRRLRALSRPIRPRHARATSARRQVHVTDWSGE